MIIIKTINQIPRSVGPRPITTDHDRSVIGRSKWRCEFKTPITHHWVTYKWPGWRKWHSTKSWFLKLTWIIYQIHSVVSITVPFGIWPPPNPGPVIGPEWSVFGLFLGPIKMRELSCRVERSPLEKTSLYTIISTNDRPSRRGLKRRSSKMDFVLSTVEALHWRETPPFKIRFLWALDAIFRVSPFEMTIAAFDAIPRHSQC